MNEFSKKSLVHRRKHYGKELRSHKIKNLLVRYFVGARALRVELLWEKSQSRATRNTVHIGDLNLPKDIWKVVVMNRLR